MARQTQLALKSGGERPVPAYSEIPVCGRRFVVDPSGALFWPKHQTLVVADLHLEKGSSYAAKGVFLPPYDTRATLELLQQVIARYAPRRVVTLGDSFHDVEAVSRLQPDDLALIHGLQERREWYWMTGNHDPELPKLLGGRVTPAMTLDTIKFRHEPVYGPASHEICGHLHPAARVVQRGHRLRRRCFVGDGARLIMPAFGAFTGGLNVLDEAFAGLFAEGGVQVWLLGRDAVYPVSGRQLLPD